MFEQYIIEINPGMHYGSHANIKSYGSLLELELGNSEEIFTYYKTFFNIDGSLNNAQKIKQVPANFDEQGIIKDKIIKILVDKIDNHPEYIEAVNSSIELEGVIGKMVDLNAKDEILQALFGAMHGEPEVISQYKQNEPLIPDDLGKVVLASYRICKNAVDQIDDEFYTLKLKVEAIANFDSRVYSLLISSA
jgi:hypothetical protein